MLEWRFKKEMLDRVKGPKKNIALAAKMSPSHVSGVLHGDRSANDEVREAILKALPGCSHDDLFFRVTTGRTSSIEPVTDWRIQADTLRRALATCKAPAEVDVDFIGTDGTFLRAVLAETAGDVSVCGPCPYRVRRLRMAIVAIPLLTKLCGCGLVTRDDLRVAKDYFQKFRRARRVRRADGQFMTVHASWRPSLPTLCATRVGNLIVFGDTGIHPINGRLNVLKVSTIDTGHPDFDTTAARIENVLMKPTKR